MPDNPPAPKAPPKSGAKGGGLSRKVGPLPLYAWLALASAGGYLWWRKKQSASTAASTGTAPTVAAAGQPTADTGDPGDGGGSGGGGTGPPLTPASHRTHHSEPLIPGVGPITTTPTTTAVNNPPPPAVSPSVTTGGTTAQPGANVPTVTNPNQSGAAPESAQTLSGISNQGTELALANRGFDVYALSSNGQYVPVIQNGVSVQPPPGTTLGAGRYYEPTQTGTKSLSKPLSKLP